MNMGDKLIFDASDPSGPSNTYMTCTPLYTGPNNVLETFLNGSKRLELKNGNLIHTPAGRPEARFGEGDGGGTSDQYRVWLPATNQRFHLFGGSASPWLLSEARVQAVTIKLQGRIEALKYGSGQGGMFVAEDDYYYMAPRARSLAIVPDAFGPWKRYWGTPVGNCIFEEGPGSGIKWYLRAESLTQVVSRATIPLCLPDGATLTNWAMQYRRTAPVSGNRFINAYLLRWPQYSTTSPIFSSAAIDVSTAEGTTNNGTKGAPVSWVIDNQNYGYSIGVSFENDTATNDGPDGLGVAGFKIDYTVSRVWS